MPRPRNQPLTAAETARNFYAGAQRSGDPERIAAARDELAVAKIEMAIRRTVAAAPPLTPAQRERLAALLTGPSTGSAA